MAAAEHARSRRSPHQRNGRGVTAPQIGRALPASVFQDRQRVPAHDGSSKSQLRADRDRLAIKGVAGDRWPHQTDVAISFRRSPPSTGR